ncbi:uncharacterized protein RCC_10637 [Ramularia collo-cygni]|uniref:NmrA-like domain-containing protein n=1 Tax=Ramularia collo-cygni TaxID=112498 RepID=A0A2D3VM84_9PEZI|nr:uncharacterized protein RCC_10637 [Ramularia collo-cygni]CZT24909.1 uncharacterized protein RCC_10637 [Ramularia collo-cygni]
MTIQKVALLGAEGNLGPSILAALTSHGFDVTVLKRQSSKSGKKYPKQVTVPDGFAVKDLVGPLQGHDAAIIAIRSEDTDLQIRFADACVQAGVTRLIPADFGSVDSSSPLTQELVPLYKQKTFVREHLIKLSQQNPTFTWTSLVCGHFFDWSLDFLHVNLPAHTIDILDDGEAQWSASTLSQIGEATARILSRGEDITKNRMIYIQSFLISQNQMVESFERATGTKWTRKVFESEKYRVEEKRKADEGDKEANENLVWFLGAVDANWTLREDFAMEDLGLEEEDFDATVKAVVAKFTGS